MCTEKILSVENTLYMGTGNVQITVQILNFYFQ